MGEQTIQSGSGEAQHQIQIPKWQLPQRRHIHTASNYGTFLLYIVYVRHPYIEQEEEEEAGPGQTALGSHLSGRRDPHGKARKGVTPYTNHSKTTFFD